jgi:hypothetical protein
MTRSLTGLGLLPLVAGSSPDRPTSEPICRFADANPSIIRRLQGHCQGDDPWCARRVRMS